MSLLYIKSALGQPRPATLSLRNISPSLGKSTNKKIKITSKGLPKDFFSNELTIIFPNSAKSQLKRTPTFTFLNRNDNNNDDPKDPKEPILMNNQRDDSQPKIKYFRKYKTQERQQIMLKNRKMDNLNTRHMSFMNVTFANFHKLGEKEQREEEKREFSRMQMQGKMGNKRETLRMVDILSGRQERMKQAKLIRKNHHQLPTIKRFRNPSISKTMDKAIE